MLYNASASFKMIAQAYEVLGDSASRARYDRELAKSLASLGILLYPIGIVAPELRKHVAEREKEEAAIEKVRQKAAETRALTAAAAKKKKKDGDQ